MPLRPALFLAAACAALAGGQARAIDLLQNGSFAGTIDGWTAVPTGAATIQYESYLGSPASGSLRLEATGVETALANQCVDVHRWVTVDFVLRTIRNSEYGDGTHDFHVEIYDGDGCVGSLLDTLTAPESGAAVDGIGGLTWTESGVYDAVLPMGARSARVALKTTAGAASKSAYLVDQVRFGPLDVLFADDFETP